MIRKQIQESMIAPPPQKIMNMKTSSPMIRILKIFVHIPSSSSCVIALSETLRYGILRNLQKTEE